MSVMKPRIICQHVNRCALENKDVNNRLVSQFLAILEIMVLMRDIIIAKPLSTT